MAGGKKSGAGDAVGRRAKRAGVRESVIILEKSSRRGYYEITNRNLVGRKSKIRARRGRAVG